MRGEIISMRGNSYERENSSNIIAEIIFLDQCFELSKNELILYFSYIFIEQ